MSSKREILIRQSLQKAEYKIEVEQLVDFIHWYHKTVQINRSTVLGYFDALTKQNKEAVYMATNKNHKLMS